MAGAMLVFAAGSPLAVPADSSALAEVLSGLAGRTQEYYDRFVSIICTETVQQQELRRNLVPFGPPRITVYEMSVTRGSRSKAGEEFQVERTLQLVNGRPARKYQEPECTDPRSVTPEPLEFLLSAKQRGYTFAMAPSQSGGPPGTVALDFVETPPERVRIKWKGNCFEAEGGGHEGRVWFDPATFDVLQVEARLSRPFLIPIPAGYLVPSVRVERSDMTIRFARVNFENPDETVVLPESIDTLNVFRGVPSLRTVKKLSNFRRFLAETTIRGPKF
jgi:hypothetical protein